ncbi:sensor histidine kinase [Aggregicoccus sp. 17bor-14]|uniref:sensor histidine kinase n=1 Tax=Myxococcaceae TaxID=31 RepID=UPI00129C7C23|nr:MULTISPECIES: histidine kinase [Myxococcaceae]MBF5043338.1 histidine kinase [Simulacricoccus sp. 17bor-14]MRI89097.1 sensor histidine kinase [Aggregicoccus sp. 17bor-14]
MASSAPSWRWPALRLRTALALLGAVLLVGLWMATTVHLAMRAEGSTEPWSRPLVWELTGTLAFWASCWLPTAAVLNAPAPAGRWGRFLGIHLASFLAFTVLKNALMVPPRFAIYRWLGWGEYGYHALPVHLGMEMMKDAVAYVLWAGACRGVWVWRERQGLALRQAQLAAELKEARLQALTGQLDPHFLFNALNTVSSLMYEDLARTDRLLADLGQVLRAGFDARRATWSLAEERAHTERYLALLHARFGERLQVAWEVAPGLEAQGVPRFSLQLLAENAVKHNQDRAEALTLRLAAWRDERENGALLLQVEDDGRGFGAPSPERGAGLGLRHLEEVLRLLYGAGARVERGAGAHGGAQVRLVLPVLPEEAA